MPAALHRFCRCILATSLVALGNASRAAAQQPAEQKWYDRLQFEGDFRPRFEYIHQDTGPDDEELPRNRLRFRLRAGVTAPVSKQVTVGFRLSTNEGKNPISSNVTFGDGAAPKTIVIDQAYATWTPNASVALTVGKFDNPLERPEAVIRSELIWDGDFTPEGFSETITLHRSSEGLLRRVAVGVQQWYLLEDSKERDTWMVGGQAQVDLKPRQRATLNLAAGYYGYPRIGSLAQLANSNDQVSISNSVVLEDGSILEGGKLIEPDPANPFDHFVSDFGQANVSAALRVDQVVGDAGLQVYGDVVSNVKADSLNTGVQVGVGLDRMGKLPGWSIAAAWAYLEQEAVLSIFSYSDLGRGGTNLKGLIAGAQWRPARNVTFAVREHIVSPIRTVQPNTATNRFQLDVTFAF